MPTKTIKNVTISYQDRGKGMPIVLVHGFPLDSRIWDAQVATLSDRYRVIAPDLRGFGQSKSSEPFTMDSQADDLHELLRQIGALPCILGGLSMGGYVVLAFAKKYSTDLKGLVLIDTRAEADAPAGRENRNRMIQVAREKGSKAIADEMFPKMMSEESVKNRPDTADKLRQIMESQSPKTIENALTAMRDREDHMANLASLNIPALIIVGQHDAVTPPAMSEAMNKGLRQSTLKVIQGAGHMSPMEKPGEVSGVIEDFAAALMK
jgi:3-oxoadipate enol-lactonase